MCITLGLSNSLISTAYQRGEKGEGVERGERERGGEGERGRGGGGEGVDTRRAANHPIHSTVRLKYQIISVERS